MVRSAHRWFRQELRLLLPYTGSGVTGFIMDIGMFWILLERMETHYLTATILGFVFGATSHFLISRFAVFKHTKRSIHGAYTYFLGIALLGLATISGLMVLAVEGVGFDATLSRVTIGTFVGVTSYFLHKHISFLHHHPKTQVS